VTVIAIATNFVGDAARDAADDAIEDRDTGAWWRSG